MQGHTDDELQGFGVQQVLGQIHGVWPALLRPQWAPREGTDPGARIKPLGVTAVRVGLKFVLLEGGDRWVLRERAWVVPYRQHWLREG